MKNIPVFCINGFLESGKSTFILSTIRRDEFYLRGKTLLIVTEQGEVEYDLDELNHYKVDVVYIDDIKDMNAINLDKLYRKYSPKRIVIEMNGMWNMNEISFPNYFEISQMITLIDGPSFPIYFNNMRQLFTDLIKISDVVAFKNVDNKEILAPYQTGLKLINSNCLYCIINEQCISTQEAFDIPLPYDLNEKEFSVSDQDFGIFYIDTFDHRPNYEGKIVEFNAWVVLSDKLESNQFIAGRKVMTCCADDVQLYGYLVNDNLGINLEHDSWIKLKASCHIEFNEQYQEEEIVLYPISIEVIDEIDNPILDLR